MVMASLQKLRDAILKAGGVGPTQPEGTTATPSIADAIARDVLASRSPTSVLLSDERARKKILDETDSGKARAKRNGIPFDKWIEKTARVMDAKKETGK